MPLISGAITDHGAIVDLAIDVRITLRQLLEKNGRRVPESVHVRAVIDTGAALSGFAPRVFRSLNIEPVGNLKIITPSTPVDQPHQCDRYMVGVSLVAGGRPHYLADLSVMETAAWTEEEGLEALIGRDILQQCFFQYIGQEQKFTLAF